VDFAVLVSRYDRRSDPFVSPKRIFVVQKCSFSRRHGFRRVIASQALLDALQTEQHLVFRQALRPSANRCRCSNASGARTACSRTG